MPSTVQTTSKIPALRRAARYLRSCGSLGAAIELAMHVRDQEAFSALVARSRRLAEAADPSRKIMRLRREEASHAATAKRAYAEVAWLYGRNGWASIKNDPYALTLNAQRIEATEEVAAEYERLAYEAGMEAALLEAPHGLNASLVAIGQRGFQPRMGE